MNIIHIFSMAGVAEMLSDQANSKGHKSFVLQLRSLDPFKFGDHYGTTIYHESVDTLLQQAWRYQNEVDYIILHDFVEYYREFPQNKLILYFHGTKLRDLLRNDPEFNKIKDKFRIIVSTPDLLDICPNAFYLPAPCDRKLFTMSTDLNDNWLAINRDYQKEYIEPKIKTRYPNVEYRNRQKEIIPYNEMPQLLKKYGNYVDWKFDYSKPEPKSVNAHSCTAIQALSCGLKVWDKDGLELSPMLLFLHDSEKVTEKFLKWLEDDQN
jgi:hypothetical protein